MIYSVKRFGKHVRMILKSDRDAPIAISGFPGEGKSTLALELMKEIIDKRLYKLDQILIYSRKELMNKIYEVSKYSGLIPDEAINMLFKRDFMKSIQKELLRLLDMCRDRNLCMFFNMPEFWEFDNHIKKRFRYWIFIPKRGIAYIFERDNNPFISDPWHLKINEKKLRQWKDGLHPSICNNFLGEIRFKPLSEEEFKEYLEVKTRKKRASEKEEDAEEDLKNVEVKHNFKLKKALVKVYDYLKRKEKDMSFMKFQRISGYSQSSMHLIYHKHSPMSNKRKIIDK